jgi:oligopeptide transport system substrate-binding protein
VDAVEMLMVNDANTSVVMYENGELDYIETPTSIPTFDVRRLRSRPDFHKGTLFAQFYMGFNTKVKPFDDPRVRRAFVMALNRQVFPQLLQSGQQPIASWIPPGMAGYNPEIGLTFNPAEAKRLLAEAGYPDGKGFPPVALSFRTLYDVQKEAEIAQALWRQNLNVPVRLRNMEWKVYLKKLSEAPSASDPIYLFRLSWYADFPDPDTFMSLFTAANGNNHTHWSHPDYERWVNQAVVTLDPQQRQALYDKAQRLLLEREAAIIPIYVAEKGYLLKPTVSGLRINSLNLINLDSLVVRSASRDANQ